MKKLLLFLYILQIVFCQDCNNPFYAQPYFESIGVQRPRYSDTPVTSKDLKYCKSFNNRLSCCNKDTDDDIGGFFKRYKDAVAQMASTKMKGFKKVFNDYEKVELQGFDKKVIQAEIKSKISVVKVAMALTNKQMVTCTIGALRASAGLLCGGCENEYSNLIINGKMALNKNNCLALANQCYSLIESMQQSQTLAQQTVMDLTSLLASKVGELPAAKTGQETSQGTKFQVNSLADFDQSVLDKLNSEYYYPNGTLKEQNFDAEFDFDISNRRLRRVLTLNQQNSSSISNQTQTTLSNQTQPQTNNNTAKIRDKIPQVDQINKFYFDIERHYALMKNYSQKFMNNDQSTYIQSEKQKFRQSLQDANIIGPFYNKTHNLTDIVLNHNFTSDSPFGQFYQKEVERWVKLDFILPEIQREIDSRQFLISCLHLQIIVS